jgi:uncharacterized membrane protein
VDAGGGIRHQNGRLLLRGTFVGHYVDVDESDHVSQTGAAEGAVAAGLVGVFGGPPGIAVGLLVGALVGAQVGPPSDAELEPQELVERLRTVIPPSSSAIVLIGESSEIDGMLAAFGQSSEDVVRRSLTADEEAALEASLRAAPPAAP